MKPDYVRQYDSFEQRHWWFRVRRIILKGLLERHAGWKPGLRVVEVGTGPGETLQALYPADVVLAGVEPDASSAELAATRSGVPVWVGTVERLPPEVAREQPDLICLFDVLEHIQDDDGALDILREWLADGGRLALSVPAYNWMWGQQDVVNMHCRRYTRGDLCRKLEQHGFTVVRATYFNSILFPFIALFRLLARLPPWRNRPAHSDFDYSAGPFDRLLYGLFRLEWPLLKYVNLPFGGSCFVLARKATAGIVSGDAESGETCP
jgi:SAM-dependent methyltransferase